MSPLHFNHDNDGWIESPALLRLTGPVQSTQSRQDQHYNSPVHHSVLLNFKSPILRCCTNSNRTRGLAFPLPVPQTIFPPRKTALQRARAPFLCSFSRVPDPCLPNLLTFPCDPKQPACRMSVRRPCRPSCRPCRPWDPCRSSVQSCAILKHVTVWVSTVCLDGISSTIVPQSMHHIKE